MEHNKVNPSVPAQDEQAYQWLEENSGLIGNLRPDQDSELYSSTLLKMVFEGQKLLARASSEDPVLVCYLNLLLAEAQIDLALVEKGASTRKMFITEGCDYCQQAVTILENFGISGLACSALPRALTILAGAYKAAVDEQRTAMESSMQKAADLLDEFREKQTYQRHQAVEKLLEGRILALSIAELPNLADRRQVLEKAAASLRQAAGLSGLAFDNELEKQAEGTLAAIEKSLATDSLPVPVLPLPSGTAESAAVIEELAGDATVMKAHPWLLGIESGPLNGQRFPLGDRLRIGRALDNDLVLTDTQVSRKHACIERAGDGYQVSDLNSGNGTLINGTLIDGPTDLKTGDLLQIGETCIMVLGPGGTAPLPLEEPTLMKPARPAAAVKTREMAASGASASQPADRRCPHCGAALKPATGFCGTCGKPVDAPAAGAEAAQPAPASTPVETCPNCGEPVRLGVKFCRKCGSKL